MSKVASRNTLSLPQTEIHLQIPTSAFHLFKYLDNNTT